MSESPALVKSTVRFGGGTIVVERCRRPSGFEPGTFGVFVAVRAARPSELGALRPKQVSGSCGRALTS